MRMSLGSLGTCRATDFQKPSALCWISEEKEKFIEFYHWSQRKRKIIKNTFITSQNTIIGDRLQTGPRASLWTKPLWSDLEIVLLFIFMNMALIVQTYLGLNKYITPLNLL